MKTLPSRHTTYAVGKYLGIVTVSGNKQYMFGDDVSELLLFQGTTSICLVMMLVSCYCFREQAVHVW